MAQHFLVFVLSALLLAVSLFLIKDKMLEADRAQCSHWLEQSTQYEAWYPADYQLSQCDYHGIDLR